MGIITANTMTTVTYIYSCSYIKEHSSMNEHYNWFGYEKNFGGEIYARKIGYVLLPVFSDSI